MQCLMSSKSSRVMTSISLDQFVCFTTFLHMNWSRLVYRDEPPIGTNNETSCEKMGLEEHKNMGVRSRG